MGLCGSKSKEQMEAEARSRALEEANQKDFEREHEKIKLLLLGAGESGKSTIFKQMRLLYGKGFTDDDKAAFRPVVYNNAIVSMKALQLACDDFGYATECKDELEELNEVIDDADIDERLGALLSTIWADPGIQEAYANRNKFQLHDSAAYYFENLDRISKPDYHVTEQDILRSRVRTSGIVDEQYDIEGVPFVLYDVGGQRNERKKWIHCFDDVTAVIFVAAISEYDQTLYEDSDQNRVMEALDLFDEICNSRWFETSGIILYLNKSDLLRDKIKTKDVNQPGGGPGGEDWFPDYTGGCDYDAAVAYLENKFMERNEMPEKRSVFCRTTCATDTENVRLVFEACKSVILQQNVAGSGFMD